MSDTTKKKWKLSRPAKLACCAVFRHDVDRWTFCKLTYGHAEAHADHRGNLWSTPMPSRRNVWPWETNPEPVT